MWNIANYSVDAWYIGFRLFTVLHDVFFLLLRCFIFRRFLFELFVTCGWRNIWKYILKRTIYVYCIFNEHSGTLQRAGFNEIVQRKRIKAFTCSTKIWVTYILQLYKLYRLLVSELKFLRYINSLQQRLFCCFRAIKLNIALHASASIPLF